MNKKEVFAHYASILDDIIEHSDFYKLYFQAPRALMSEELVAPNNINTMLYFGATRCCIVDETYDYVVKFDTEEDDIGGSICERECAIYRDACERGLNQYFTEAVYLGTYEKEIEFYDYIDVTRYIDFDCPEDFYREFDKYSDEIGEKYTIVISVPLFGYKKVAREWDEPFGSDCLTYDEKARHINSPMRERCISVAIDFIYNYGEEEYARLTDFLYEEHINDLHSDNVGGLDGKIVFCDYAGCHEYGYSSI